MPFEVCLHNFFYWNFLLALSENRKRIDDFAPHFKLFPHLNMSNDFSKYQCGFVHFIGIVGVIVAVFLQPVNAQSFKFKHYTTEDGLPHNVGYDILQDRQGYIWLGMDNGLTRFDGINFQTYGKEAGLEIPYVITLSEDPHGRLWMGTHRFKVHYKNPGSDTLIVPRFYQQDFSDAEFAHSSKDELIINALSPQTKYSFESVGICSLENSDSLSCIRYFLFEEKGELQWIQYEGQRADIIRLRKLLNERETGGIISLNLFQKDTNEVYFLTSIGMYGFDPSKDRFHPIYPTLLPRKKISAMDIDGDKDEWIAAGRTIFKVIQGQRVRKYQLPIASIEVQQMKVIREDKIILLDANRKDLYTWNPESGEIINISDHIDFQALISFIEYDREENLWITTMGNGVFYIQDHGVKNYTLNQGLPSSFINGIHEDDQGNILMATTKGMAKIVGDKIELIYPEFEEEINDVFFNAKSGYFHFNTSEFNYLVKDGKISSLPAEFIHGRISVNQAGQHIILKTINNPYSINLYIFENGKLSYEFINIKWDDYPNSSPTGNSFVKPEEGVNRYWINDLSGLMAVTRDEAQFYSTKDGLPSNKINDIAQDVFGKMWFATEDGIAVYEEGRIVDYSNRIGLNGIPFRRILFDKMGRLWIGTPEGLYVWNGDKISQFNTYTGLVANDVNCLYIDTKEQLWIGTSAGISVLDLNNLPPTSSPPQVVIENVLVNNQVVDTKVPLSIPQNQPLAVNYTALTFIAPDRISFQYKLREDAEWQTTTNRSLRMSDLQSGDYTFYLRARKINTDWGEPKHFSFEIIPPWWRTPGALIVWALLGIGLVGGLFRFRIQHVRKKVEAKMTIDRELGQLKLKVLQSQLNPHFIFNALNVIQGYILENDIEASNLYLERFSHLMRMFLESSKKDSLSLKEELELLTLFIEMEQLCYEGRFTYELYRDPQLDPNHVRIPSMLIQPFVENAIHHGLLRKIGQGNLQIRFEAKDSEVRCLIIDDGIGRKKAQQFPKRPIPGYQSRGMQIVSERLQMQNQLEKSNIRIQITDVIREPNEIGGTRVEILFPLQTVATVI